MSKYQNTIDFLFHSLPMYQRVGKVAYKANLDNSHKLDAHLGYPHKNFKAVHVAGTNGKGSVSHTLASVLQLEGYKVGLYTSPHLLDFRERIRVNSEMISEQAVVDFVDKHKDFFLTLQTSFFEMTVFMAFQYFADCKVDIAIIEVGLGGRLDSTNVISPLLSIITNIGLDHTQFLGNTLELIAGEKAGIIKENIPVVIGEKKKETAPTFQTIAHKNNSKIFFAEDNYRSEYALRNIDQTIRYKLTTPNPLSLEYIETDLQGSYQEKNICTSLQAIELLNNTGFFISPNNILKGMRSVTESTGLLGRWQIVNYNPLSICDTAHNKEGITEIVKQIEQTAYKNLHLVLGFVNDKDIQDLLNLFPKEANYYFAPLNIERSCKIEELKQAGEALELNFSCSDKIISAYNKASKIADDQDLIFIGGSTFTVADFLCSENI